MIKAIANDNYESLEAICEESFLIELAAKIYEMEKFKNIQFRLLNEDQSSARDFDIQVINHFYINNMSVKRKENPSLKEFKMVPKARNVLELVSKDQT